MIACIIGTMDDPDDQLFMKMLYQDFERLMFSTAKRYISNASDQMDIVQDSMEKLIKKIATIRPMNRCTLASYIVYTIRSTSIDLLRAQKRTLEHTVTLDDQEFSEIASAAPSPDNLDVSAERLMLLKKAWPDLSEESRILLEGKYILGYTDKELAAVLGCKPDSIRMKLTRARRQAFALMDATERGVTL